MYRVLKRCFDIIFSVIGIIGTMPLWLIAIIGIEISDAGPIFYMAQRVGKDNKQFKMFKFRSMYQGKSNEGSFRGDNDRIFAFGKFIRCSKIDELPQLINILIGDMSIVGPRPASVDQLDFVRNEEYLVVSTVAAGLTGPSALYDYICGDVIEDEKEYVENILPIRLALDSYYVNNMSFTYDLKMIWYTIVSIFYTLFKKTPTKILSELISSAKVSKKNLDYIRL